MSDSFDFGNFRNLGEIRMAWRIFHGDPEEVNLFLGRHRQFDRGNHPWQKGLPRGRPPGRLRSFTSRFESLNGTRLTVLTYFNAAGKATTTILY
jgi:hypothetical protein